MTKPYQHWTVLPHGKFSQVDDGMLTVTGQIRMPLGSFPRRMTVVRLRDSRLVVWSAIALDAKEMGTFEVFGRPAFLIVPNDHHRLDAKVWKERYPKLKVVAPKGRVKIEKVVRRHGGAGLATRTFGVIVAGRATARPPSSCAPGTARRSY
jgi:hypothetical protein